MKLFASLLLILSQLTYASSTRTIDADTITSSDHSKTYTLPSATDTVVGRATTDTLTNKSIDGGSNTLTGVTASALSSGASASGNVATADGAGGVSYAAAAASPNQSYELSNFGVSVTTSSNTLVIALKQGDGSTNCSAGSPCKIGFRSTTATTGGYTQVLMTASASLTLAAVDSIGAIAAIPQTLYIYLVSDTTTEICASSTLFDEGSLANASALTGGADVASQTLWCTSAHTSRPIRIIGSVSATWSNPNWGSITTVSIPPFSKLPRVEAAAITTACSASPCTVASQSMNWISSVTRTSAGVYVVNFNTGVFSAAPWCVVTSDNSGSGSPFARIDTNPTTSSFGVRISNSSTGVDENGAFTWICVGPR